jgi:hypothetical protein
VTFLRPETYRNDEERWAFGNDQERRKREGNGMVTKKFLNKATLSNVMIIITQKIFFLKCLSKNGQISIKKCGMKFQNVKTFDSNIFSLLKVKIIFVLPFKEKLIKIDIKKSRYFI